MILSPSHKEATIMFEALFIDRDTIARYRRRTVAGRTAELPAALRARRVRAARSHLRTIARRAQITLIRLLGLREGERVSLPRIGGGG